jgi:vacuolar-type H+-ATPase subunit E/Vma4
MTIDKIIQKIKAETAVDVDKILKNAYKSTKEMRLKAKKELMEHVESVRDNGEKRITIMRNIHLSEARRASSRNILNAKEELIETCFAQAREHLRTLTGQEYHDIMTRLIKESLALIGDSGVATLTREEDKAILSSFPHLTVKPKLAPGLGGLIIESKDGKIVVDNTFEAILKRHKEDIRTEVANILYPDED